MKENRAVTVAHFDEQRRGHAWYAENGTIIITYDEDEGEGKIATVVVHGAGLKRTETASGNHYGTLATIEDLYGVPRLGLAALATTTLAPLLK